jgi:hypothetical protein
MFADHVISDLLQRHQVIPQSLQARGRVQAIRPEALVQGTELEEELAIEQRALDAVDLASGDGSESGIALDGVASELDGDVVQGGRIRRPQLGRVHGEVELRVGRSFSGAYDVGGSWLVDCDLYRCASVASTRDIDSDCHS